jgi:hypothetical protein
MGRRDQPRDDKGRFANRPAALVVAGSVRAGEENVCNVVPCVR